MGFETQEEAERFAENIEFLVDNRREERLLDPKLNAWLTLTELPAYKDMTPALRELQRSVFEYAWLAAMRVKP